MQVNFEKKDGETVAISIAGLDANSKQQSKTDHEVNGLSNAEANMIYDQVANMVMAFMKKLADEKGKKQR